MEISPEVINQLFLKQLAQGRAVRLKAKGTSMSPMIRQQDILLIKKKENLRRGDVVLYTKANRFFIHRLMKKNKDFFLIKGDQLPNFDQPVRKEEILGVVEEIKRAGRKIKIKRWKNYFWWAGSYFNLFFYHQKIKKLGAIKWKKDS